MSIILLLWPFVCGVANRIRGGFLMNIIKYYLPFWSTTPARIFVSLIISLPIFLTYPLRNSIIFFLLLYVGFIWRWSPWNTMDKPLEDIILLSIRGWVLTFPAGFYLNLPYFACCGLLMGITYYLAYVLPLHYTDCTGYTWDASDWGELFFGFILGFFVCICCI